jgi:catechol 2,3-dioxygenase-like lactoylglutathione lyase family enzyme
MTTANPPLVVTKADGTQIDHIGLACRDLEEGVRYFRDKTGVEPHVNQPVEGLPFQNAYVRIGDATFLEILGPNPKYSGMHPLKSLLKRFSEPVLWFWYVSTDDFDGLETAIRDAGRRIERKTVAEAGAETGPAFVGASIGPGFWPVYPNVIQWKGDLKEALLKDLPIVPIKTFSVVIIGQQLETAKEFFENVGIDGSYLRASDDEKSYLFLTLKTPDKGPVTFQSEVESLSTWKVLKTLLKDLFGFL